MCWKLSRIMVYRVRARVMSMIIREEEQFRMLRSYYKTLLDTNSRAACVINTTQYQVQFKFRGVYIYLNSLMKGFLKGCRHHMGFDSCHLSSRYKGILLVATSVDDKNHMYFFV